MEEQVGQIWHRFITRLARTEYPEAVVHLDEVRRTVGILFRALGGDGGLRIEATTATHYQTRRNWLQRIAGAAQQVELAWRSTETLCLPAHLAVFPEKILNRELYLWLAALAAFHSDTVTQQFNWFLANQVATRDILARFPGLRSRYQRLMEATLALRPNPAHLPSDESVRETAIQAALRDPGSINHYPIAQRQPMAVWLWLHPEPPLLTGKSQPRKDNANVDSGDSDGQSQAAREQRKKKGERTEPPDGKSGLLAFRFESLFTRAEYAKVDRTEDEEEDLAKAQDALEDMDHITVTQAEKKAAVSLRFDLDLPAQEQDDYILEGDILLPEWDWKRGELRNNYCCLQTMIADNAPSIELPQHLRRSARKLRHQFQAVAPLRSWHRHQNEGSDIDLDAWLSHTTDILCGHAQVESGFYRDFRGGNRDLACLLLADLSLSTDAWVNNSARVIDIIRDSLFLFSEALHNTGDRFALYGFSSRRRDHVRFHHLKTFKQNYNAATRGHIQAIKPGYYTRMGAAIRHATNLLIKESNSQRLLLLLTDGKPNDLDHYEGRYGVEDTRHAVLQARKKGLQVFCVTIDERAEDYLPHLFGAQHYVLIRKAEDLPKTLPLLYMRLTQT